MSHSGPRATLVTREGAPAQANPENVASEEAVSPGGGSRLADGGDTEATQLADPFGTSLPAGIHALGDAADSPYGASRLVGRYQVVERVGHGAMATVYKAYDPSIHRTLALKFLHPTLCADHAYRERFLREARAAGVLSHPCIVTVFDVGEVAGRPYIAMEFLEGAPLSEVVGEGVSLPLREVVDIGIQLARALGYAHGKGIVHRDIKPANIVRLRGAGSAIKVADFGIAHVDSRETANETRAGSLLGTPHYMSPEQALGQRADARSDLFSTGVVLYQLLTGQTPFQADNLVTLAHKIAKEDPKSVAQLRPDVPASLRRVIERCLRKQPEKRFQNGAELAQALEKVARELEEHDAAKDRQRIVPLRVKWTLIMATVVALTMAVTASIVTSRQNAALRDEVVNYGSSLARFMATEHAVPALAEDWVAIEVVVQELMKTGDFHDIAVADRQGVVRVSSDPGEVGQPRERTTGQTLQTFQGSSAVETVDRSSGAKVFAFEAPITFQGKEVGKVHLGLPGEPLARVTRLALILMALLVLVTVGAVIVATYLIANRYSKPIALVADSMAEIGKRRFDYRIAEKRDDEFGQLYNAFDEMASALQSSAEAPGKADGKPG